MDFREQVRRSGGWCVGWLFAAMILGAAVAAGAQNETEDSDGTDEVEAPAATLGGDPSVSVAVPVDVDNPDGSVVVTVSADGRSTDVRRRPVDIWSDGTRLSGDLFYPAGAPSAGKLPAIVLAHGWGGTRDHLNRTYAPRFAAEGFAVLSFDYRGWGDSDSRLLLVGEQPEPDASGQADVRVVLLREVVQPFDHLEDLAAAIDFIVGEPIVDADRIGLWGTSFGGGHVVWTAAHDPRIDAIVAQVGAQDSAAALEKSMGERAPLMMQNLATQRARGKTPAVPQNAPLPGLRGSPVMERVYDYRPIEHADRVRAATLIVDAEKEELFDIALNGRAVYEIVRENAPAEYHVFPITHYEIYSGEYYEKALDLQIDWFRRHLREAPATE